MTDEKEQGLRLLVLDSGDVRSLSQLEILDEFLYQVRYKKEQDEDVLPQDYFDLIVASGIAGIIAILFVSFKMTVQEVQDAFTELWTSVFAPDILLPIERSAKLASWIKNLMDTRNMPPERKLLSRDKGCKALICVASPQVLTTNQNLRTYDGRRRGIDVTVAEAIQATCALPDRFLPVKVGRSGRQEELISAEYILGNPTRAAIKELHDIYGSNRKVACILSLGCGKPAPMRIVDVGGQGERTIRLSASLQAERTAEEMQEQLGSTGCYFRFSVDHGLETSSVVSGDDFGPILTHSRVYLQQAAVSSLFDAAVENPGLVATGDLAHAQVRPVRTTNGIPPLCASFVVRHELRASMKHVFTQLDCDVRTQRIMILSGMGGSGKTQLVASFVRDFAHQFSCILFIDASSEDTIKNGLISKVRALGKMCRTADDALFALAQPEYILNSWLIVYDNVDDPKIKLSRFFPLCDHGYIIVTTRNPTQGDLSPQSHIKVDVMTEAEALKAFLSAAFTTSESPTEDDQRHAQKIVKELDYLPVAVIQAASFVKRRHCISDYLGYLKKHRAKILSEPSTAQRDRYYDGVYAALDVTLPELSEKAKNFLGLLACFNYAGFPIELFARGAKQGFLFEPFDLLERSNEIREAAGVLRSIVTSGGEWDKLYLDELIVELEEYSLVTVVTNHSSATLRFHSLVHAWVHDRICVLKPEEYHRAALRLLVSGAGVENEDLFQYLIPNLQPSSSIWDGAHVNDLAVLAQLTLWEGKSKDAIKKWSEINQQVSDKIGSEHVRTYRAQLQLGLAYDAANDSKALSLIQRAASYRWLVLGHDHIETLEASSLANELLLKRPSYLNTFHIDNQREIVAKLRGLHQTDYSLILLRAMEALARMHLAKNWEETAKNLLEEIILGREHLQGPHHVSTVRSKELLAKVRLRRRGRRQESMVDIEGILRIGIERRKEQLGATRPETLQAQVELAQFYEKARRDEEAEPIWKDLIDKQTEMEGRDALLLVSARTSLARLYERTRRHDAAIIEWQHVLEGSGVVLETSVILSAKAALAQLYSNQKQYDAAVDQWMGVANASTGRIRDDAAKAIATICVERMATVKSTSDVYKCDVPEVLEEVARAFQERGQMALAVAQWELALQSRVQKHSKSLFTLRTRETLARLYEEQGNYQAALNQWAEALKLGAQALANDATQRVVQLHRKVSPDQNAGSVFQCEDIAVMVAVAQDLERQEKYDIAIAQWKYIVEASSKKEGDCGRSTLLALESLASLYTNRRKYTRAIMQRKLLVERWEMKEGPESYSTLIAMESLAELYSQQRRYKESMRLWQRVVKGWEGKEGPTGYSTLRVMKIIATLYEVQRQYEQAIVQWRLVMERWRAKEGDDSLSALPAMESLASLYEKCGSLAEATSLWDFIVKGRKEREGINHISTLQGMERQASLYERQEQYVAATAIRQFLVVGWRAKAGIGDPLTLESMEALASLYAQQDHFEKAIKCWRILVEGWRVDRLADRASMFHSMQSVAGVLRCRYQYDLAMSLWKLIARAWERVEGATSLSALSARESIADIHAIREEYEDAIAHWDVIVERRNGRRDSNSRSVFDAVDMFARTCEQKRQYSQAISLWEFAIKCARLEGLSKARSTRSAMKSLARIYEAQHMYDLAITQWSLVVALRQDSSVDMISILMEREALAKLHEKSGNHSEAVIQRQLIASRIKEKGVRIYRHEGLKDCIRSLIDGYESLGRRSDAEKMRTEFAAQLTERSKRQGGGSSDESLSRRHLKRTVHNGSLGISTNVRTGQARPRRRNTGSTISTPVDPKGPSIP